MKLFLDRNLPPVFANAFGPILDRVGVGIEASIKKYPDDPGDEVWLAELAAEGHWVVVTADKKMRTNPGVKVAWHKAALTTFFLRPQFLKHGFDEMHWRLAKRLPEFVKLSKSYPTGTGFDVPYQASSAITVI